MPYTPPKLIYVVGVQHALQVPFGPRDPKEYEDQIDRYRQELTALARKYRFDLYCEEISHRAFSIAEQCAIDRRKRYVNIDMPKDIRTKLGIKFDYATGSYDSATILQWHITREEYMYERATDRMQPGTVSIVICGDEHLARLKERFEQIGGKVEAESFLQKPWYRPEVFKPESYL